VKQKTSIMNNNMHGGLVPWWMGWMSWGVKW
jgi:hypothetical protein